MDSAIPQNQTNQERTSLSDGRRSDAPSPQAVDAMEAMLPPVIVSDSLFASPAYQPLEIYDNGNSPSPVVASCPHAGRSYPASLLDSSCSEIDALRGLEDFGVDCLIAGLSGTGITCVVNRVARGYLDVNRAATALDKSMFDGRIAAPSACHHVRAGYGLLPKLTASRKPIYDRLLDAAEADRRITTVHTPYHNALARLMDKAEAWHGKALLVDFHSMPAYDRLNNRLPDIICGDGYGVTLDRTTADAMTGFFQKAGLSISWNHPYAGGFITRSTGDAKSTRQAVQIEINRDLYMDGALRLDPARAASLAATMTDFGSFLISHTR